MRQFVRGKETPVVIFNYDLLRRNLARAVAFFGVLMCGSSTCLLAPRARADVTTIDDVWVDIGGTLMQDNPFTLFNEGIPTTGNSINRIEGMMQTNYEGRTNELGTSNVNFDNIIVGRSSSGQLILSGPFSVLNDEDLTIGDMGPLQGGGSGNLFRGTGVVRIEGNGALYSNNPLILPYPLTTSPSVDPRPTDVGFDAYVGRSGTGSLYVSLGGRAEIQDALIIGDQPFSTGLMVVDGIDTIVRSGGFETPAGTPVNEVHSLTVGHLGAGTLTLSGGAQIFSDAPDDVFSEIPFAAVIGGEHFITNQVPEGGGTGVVNVTGSNTNWQLRGALQIGGWDNIDGPFGPQMNLSEGDNVTYSNSVGRGTLNITQGGSVEVVPLDDEQISLPLEVISGRYGKIVMDYGTLSIGGNIGTDPQSSEPNDQIRLFNDGKISGDGEITTGVFYNRYYGEMEVGINQHMIVNALSQFTNPSLQLYPWVNWGVIRVIGNHDYQAELDFERSTMDGLASPFQNRALTNIPATGRVAGFIQVNFGILRFRTGVENQGTIAFTGGENRVTGDVANLVGDSVTMTPNGLISVTGVGTHVIFEGSVANNGQFDIRRDASPVEILGDFTQVFSPDPVYTGKLSLELVEGTPERLQILGDAILGGTLEVSVIGPAPQAGDVYSVLAATGDLFGIFNAQVLPTLAPTLGWTVDYNYALDTVALRVLSLSTVMGADFNGDGVIDLQDLAVWQTNFGIVSGASPLQGDADGDGDVDGNDFLLWQMQISPGAGSGAGNSLVPEPASMLLILMGGILAMGIRGRQR